MVCDLVGASQRQRRGRAQAGYTLPQVEDNAGQAPSADVEDACKRHMTRVNANTRAVKPEQVLTISDFVDTVYLPWVRANKRAATINGYEKIWKKHHKGHFENMLLRDYQSGCRRITSNRYPKRRKLLPWHSIRRFRDYRETVSSGHIEGKLTITNRLEGWQSGLMRRS